MFIVFVCFFMYLYYKCLFSIMCDQNYYIILQNNNSTCIRFPDKTLVHIKYADLKNALTCFTFLFIYTLITTKIK